MNESYATFSERKGSGPSALWIVLLFAILATIRILAPSDLHDGDQPKQADYVIDIVCNGNWIVQHHADGSIMSKPPLYNWIAAPLVLLFGPEDVWLKMPSLLAGIAAALLTWDLARRRLGERPALWGTLFLLLTSMFVKQIYYARTDMLLTCFIVMQFWAIVRWEDSAEQKSGYRSGWIWIFWIAAALGNLTKGPLALLPHLALSALWIFDGRFKERYAQLGVWWGLPLAMLPLLIWFGFAYRAEGYAVYEHMVKAEVVARFQATEDKLALKGADKSNRNFFYYIPHVFSRNLPWSLFGLIGIWSIFTAQKNAEVSERQRGMLYFLAAWFFTTVLFFSIVPSKRADRIFPAIPALCLLAGWAFDECLKFAENRASKRIEHRVSEGLVVLIWAIFFAAGLAMLGFGLGANFGPFKLVHQKLPAIMLANLTSSVKIMVAIFGSLLVASSIYMILFRKRHTTVAVHLIAANLVVMAMYQQFFGNWMLNELAQGSAMVCRAVRTRARDENVAIMVIAGSDQPARFYLLKPGLETPPVKIEQREDKPPPPKDAITILSEPHPAMYVVGTEPSMGAKRRIAGGLETVGLGGAPRIEVQGVPKVDEAKLPAIPWLGAVFVSERK